MTNILIPNQDPNRPIVFAGTVSGRIVETDGSADGTRGGTIAFQSGAGGFTIDSTAVFDLGQLILESSSAGTLIPVTWNGTLIAAPASPAEPSTGLFLPSVDFTAAGGSLTGGAGAKLFLADSIFRLAGTELGLPTDMTRSTFSFEGGGADATRALSQAFTLNDAETVQVTDSRELTLAAPVGGAGSLTKAGTGTLILGADNTYAGGTTISAGTLQIGNGATSGSIPGDVVNNGVLAFNRADTYTFGGVISGTGELQQNGPGTTILSGTSTYTGDTTVSNGILSVNGNIPFSSVIVAGGSLQGSGTVGGLSIQNGAAVAPGNSIGTLDVAGDITFSPGSFFDVEIAAAGASDLINATGTATLNAATVRVDELDPETSYIDGQRYLILQAGTRVGEFNPAVAENSSFLEYTLDHDPAQVFLEVRRVVIVDPGDPDPRPIEFSDVAETSNQREAADALEEFDQTPGSDALLVFNQLLQLDAGSARAAFDAASGEVHASAQHTQLDAAGLFAQANQRRAALLAGAAVSGRLAPNAYSFGSTQGTLPAHVMAADLVDVPVEAVPIVAERRVLQAWAAGLGATGEIEGDGNAAGIEHDAYGVAGGFDGNWDLMGGALVAGISGGYTEADADVEERRSSADVTSGHFGVYLGWDDSRLALSAAASYSFHDIETTRRIAFGGVDQTAEANYDGDTLALTGEAAYRIGFGRSYVAPVGTVDALFGQHDGATETGAGALALTIDEADYERIDAGIGLAFGTEWAAGTALVRAEARVLYEHAFGDEVPDQGLAFAGSPGTGFTVLGPARAEDFLTVGAGIGVSFTEALTMTADYEGSFSDRGDTHGGHLALGYKF